MEGIISSVTSNKILLFLCVVICVMLVIAVIRRFFWLFVTAAIAVIIYAGYLAYNGQKIPTTKDEIIEHGRQKLENLKEKASEELLEKTKEKAVKSI
ncbi:MAG: hypothetical protein FWG13_07910 [Leptospirales bacterium]|nr:hypothetical protein [Leptospirales bacterium]